MEMINTRFNYTDIEKFKISSKSNQLISENNPKVDCLTWPVANSELFINLVLQTRKCMCIFYLYMMMAQLDKQVGFVECSPCPGKVSHPASTSWAAEAALWQAVCALIVRLIYGIVLSLRWAMRWVTIYWSLWLLTSMKQSIKWFTHVSLQPLYLKCYSSHCERICMDSAWI